MRAYFEKLVEPSHFFLWIVIPFASLFIFLTPPFNVADENAHFFRSYGLSLGQLKAIADGRGCGSMIPASVVATSAQMADNIAFNPNGKLTKEKILEQFRRPLDPEQLEFARYPNTAPYSPVPYLPQIAAILVGRLFDAPAIMQLYLARLFNAAAAIALLFLAIRGMPTRGWALAAAHLTPMAIFQLASASADAMTFALTALVISLAMRLVLNVDRIQCHRQAWKIGLIATGMTLAKFAYAPLLLIFFIAPRDSIGRGWPEYFKRMTILVLPSIIMQALWVIYVKDAVVATRTDIVVDTTQQALFVIMHPFHYLKAVVVSWQSTWAFYLESYLGILGWLDTLLPERVRVAAGIGIMLAFLVGKPNEMTLQWWHRLALAAVGVVSILSIFFFLYLYWNPVGANQVEGVQGRYFIPLGIIVALILGPHLPKSPRWNRALIPFLYALFIFSAFHTAKTLLRRYYAG